MGIDEILEKLIDSYDYATDTGSSYDYKTAKAEIQAHYLSVLPEKKKKINPLKTGSMLSKLSFNEAIDACRKAIEGGE